MLVTFFDVARSAFAGWSWLALTVSGTSPAEAGKQNENAAPLST
jgi:hypothetical protein